MASIKLGAILADIRGKLAGNYFAKRKNTTVLAVCGSKLTKADAGRVALQQSRNNLTSVSRGWSALTAAQQLVWTNAAALLTWYTKVSIAYSPSGYQLFSQRNLNRLKIGLSQLTDYAEPLPPANIDGASIKINGDNDIVFEWDSGIPVGKAVVVSASFPNSTGVQVPKGGLKVLAVLGSGTTMPKMLTSDYQSLYGTNPTSNMVFFKLELIDTQSGAQEGSKLTKADAGLV